jgi:thioredoxin 1
MAAPNILNLTKDNFSKEVLQSPTPVLVDFWAQWCSPCRALSPILDELAEEYDGRIKIGKVDTEQQQELAVEYGIRGIPTMLLFSQGQVVDQIVGLKSKRDIKSSFERVAA